MNTDRKQVSSETSSSTFFEHHRLLENRSNLNELDQESEVGQGHRSSSSSESEHRRNWIPRRRNSIPDSSSDSHSEKATGMTRRCVCNLSQCASTNYMCKSEKQVHEDGTESEAGCFIEAIASNTPSGSSPTAVSVQTSTRPSSARRGCIEMLSREKQELCRTQTGGGGPLECCFEDDMCNYPKTFHSNNLHPTQGTFTNSVSRIPFEPSGGRLGSMDHEVWLRAAVIAVPICGLIILILLIYIARKLLSSDDAYKENGSNYHYSRKVHHYHPKAGELLLPNAPHVLDLSMTSPPPHAGHCWCSAPRSTAYLLPDNGNEGQMDPMFPPAALDRSVWNQIQEDSANRNGNQQCPTNRSPPWQNRINLLHSKVGLRRELKGRDTIDDVDNV